MNKIDLFEYFLKELVEWFCDSYGIVREDFNQHPSNDLSKLKVIKLHFFACSTDVQALQVFDDFRAMPYGHVESEVYASINKLSYFEITNSKLIVQDDSAFTDFLPEGFNTIRSIIANLKDLNAKLIQASPFDLVELSHKWFSWKYTFNEAKKENSFSRKINPKIILNESKLYRL